MNIGYTPCHIRTTKPIDAGTELDYLSCSRAGLDMGIFLVVPPLYHGQPVRLLAHYNLVKKLNNSNPNIG